MEIKGQGHHVHLRHATYSIPQGVILLIENS